MNRMDHGVHREAPYGRPLEPFRRAGMRIGMRDEAYPTQFQELYHASKLLHGSHTYQGSADAMSTRTIAPRPFYKKVETTNGHQNGPKKELSPEKILAENQFMDSLLPDEVDTREPFNSIFGINGRKIVVVSTVANQLKTIIFNSWSYLLPLVAPVCLVLYLFNFIQTAACISFIMIIPLMNLLAFATEEVAMHAGESLSDFLTAAFGNTVELTVAIALLRGGLTSIHTPQISYCMFLSVSQLVGIIRAVQRSCYPIYGTPAPRKTLSIAYEQEDQVYNEEEEPQLHAWVAVFTLAASSVMVALCSWIIVDVMMPRTVLAFVALPFLGNALEHATAITVAFKDKIDLTIYIVVRSAMRIALSVTSMILVYRPVLGRLRSISGQFQTISISYGLQIKVAVTSTLPKLLFRRFIRSLISSSRGRRFRCTLRRGTVQRNRPPANNEGVARERLDGSWFGWTYLI